MVDGFPYKTKKPKQSSYAKYKSFTSFMKTIMKTSLITSFPVIATSKSWIKRILKITVFILCLIGFSYQTLDFLWMYLGYPTVVNVFISNPYEIVQPGVTICNKNRRRRTFLCSKPSFCSFDNPVEFCKNYPEKCPGKKPSLAYTGRPYLHMIAEDYYYWDETFEESHNESMIDSCEAKIGMKTLPCNNFTQIPVIDAKGEPNTCITIDSLVGQPDAEDTVHPNTYILELTLKTQAEEYVSFTDPVMLQIMIHNRRAIINPFSEGSSLQSGAQYNVYVSQTTKERLPAPYDTDCVDYLAMWKENNGTGPLDHMMCVELCKLQKLLDMDECIDKDVDYPHTEELCKRGSRSITSDIVKNCTIECGNPCLDKTYEVRYEKIGDIDSFCDKDDIWCKNEKIIVTLKFNKFRLTRFVYQPKFASVEMFSYIGGYMGMWLGLSLVSLFDLYETICYLMYYPIARMRLKSKKKTLASYPLKKKDFHDSLGFYY